MKKNFCGKNVWPAGILAVALVFLALAAFPLPVLAASDAVQDIDITVELQPDGSALITEVWDITQSNGTERFIERVDLDEQEISGLRVWEEGVEFENTGAWDVNASLEEKAGKCGVVTRSDGYELCWGIGSYGRHVFTLQYHITNVVKGYQGADAIYQNFVNNLDSGADHVRIVIRSEGLAFTPENTGVWGGRTTGEIYVRDGVIVAETTEGYRAGDRFSVLVEFMPGLFHPAVQRSQSFEDLKEKALEGSSYVRDPEESKGGVLGSILPMLIGLLPVVITAGVGAIAVGAAKKGKSGMGGGMKPEYKNPEYSRELPFQGSLPASYTRLKDLDQLENEGDIIGVYLLRWVRSSQVELMTLTKNGLFKNKEEDAIKLYTARPEMEAQERKLYDMLVQAAGADWVLESKEFERWSKKNYEKVEGWLTAYRNSGTEDMRNMGAAGIVEETHFFGLLKNRVTRMTPEGEAMTTRMFGFKKYLQDFTIINERQAREVALWDEYLVFAQLFGIADAVAAQFKELYPDYFARMAANLGYGQPDMFDIYLLTRMSRNYSRALTTGYRAGYNAAHSTAWSGGGGGFSGGGGFGGASGGGSSGGR